MDILNWLYLKKQELIRTTLDSPKDLLVLGADVGFQKRGDKYQTYAMPAEDFILQALNFVGGDLIPSIDNTYTLGSPARRWKSIHIGEGTIYITDAVTGDVAELTIENGIFFVNGIAQAQLPDLQVTNLTFNDSTVQTTAFNPTPTSFNPQFIDAGGLLAGVTTTGSYTLIGNICYFRVAVEFSGCTNFGTTQYQITLPFPSISTMRQANGTLHQPSLSAQYHIAGITDVDTAADDILLLYYSGSTTDLAWKNTTPVGATTVTSHFDISGVYEIA